MAKLIQRLHNTAALGCWLKNILASFNTNAKKFLPKHPGEMVEHIAKTCSSRGPDKLKSIWRTTHGCLTPVAISSTYEYKPPHDLVTLQSLSTRCPQLATRDSYQVPCAVALDRIPVWI